MRRLVIALLASFVCSLGIQGIHDASAGGGAVTIRSAIDFVGGTDCADHEPVRLTGTVLLTYTTVQDANGGGHGTYHVVDQGVQGVGLISGDHYVLTGVQSSSGSFFYPDVKSVEIAKNIAHLVRVGESSGPDDDLVIVYTLRLINSESGNGMFFEFDEIVCQ